MDSTYLLVIEDLPDKSQAINSYLRNAGLAVRVINASTYDELESAIKHKQPFLILIGTQPPAAMNMARITQSADQHSIPVALQLNPEDTTNIMAAIITHPVLVMNATENDQLMQLVKQHMSGGRTASEFSALSDKLEELQHRYDLILDNARDSVAYIHEGLHIYANRAYLDLLQMKTLDEIEGVSFLDLMTADSGTDLKKLLRDMKKNVFPEETLAVTILTPTRQSLKADLTFSPARFNGEQCIQMFVHKQDANLALREEVKRLRKTDHLTQMINRHSFINELDTLIEQGHREDSKYDVLYIETDGINELHDDLGMEGIDTFIMDLANIISACIEETDIPARFSDHSFVVLTKRDKHSTIEDTCDRILENYSSQIIDLKDQTLSASCSIGQTTLGSLTRNAKEVIAQARAAFKQASQTGNTLAQFKPALTTVNSDQSDRDWVERIQYALNNHDFYTVQQSIVDIEGENKGLFENITFMRERDGDTQVSEFMLAADRHSLGSTIDRRVIPQLILAIAGTSDKHIIALSMNSILDFSFPNWFQRTLDETDVAASQLILQVSGITAELNLKPTRRTIDELKSLGCGIILADFNDELRMVQLLEHLPIDMVKLSPGLAQGLSSNAPNQESIRAIVSAVEPYNIKIIADEVRDATDLAVLWQCGVKLVAGDFLNEAPQVVGK